MNIPTTIVPTASIIVEIDLPRNNCKLPTAEV